MVKDKSLRMHWTILAHGLVMDKNYKILRSQKSKKDFYSKHKKEKSLRFNKLKKNKRTLSHTQLSIFKIIWIIEESLICKPLSILNLNMESVLFLKETQQLG